MTCRVMRRLRGNVVAYLLVFLVIGGGGGYALAATKTKAITACADKGTGVLHFKPRGGRCRRGQTRVSWNQQGLQGVQGTQGPAGQPGAPAVSVWADIANAGSVIFGQGVSVQHVAAGTYQVTITAPACAQASNVPVITVADTNPPGGQVSGAFPVAWFQAAGDNQQFYVYTGVVVGGSFTPTDHSFDLIDTCM